jgi:hypothetical protein
MIGSEQRMREAADEAPRDVAAPMGAGGADAGCESQERDS